MNGCVYRYTFHTDVDLNDVETTLDAALLAVLIFTPLAFGSVEPWAQAIGQGMIWTLFAGWCVKAAWTPQMPAERKRYWTGLEGPILLFTLVLVLQEVPHQEEGD